jgi:2-polyprenyl-3-methyl-5-hydroxy-6-metoxy-1,4-benzoquinol methylase
MTARTESSRLQPGAFDRCALVPRSCPLCGSNSEERIFAPANFDPAALDSFAFSSRKVPENMHHRLVACERCDLLYSSPIPPRDLFEAAYRDAAFDASYESHLASVTYGRILRKILPSLPDREGALDVGTGDGAFLQQLLELGFSDVVGVEPSQAPVGLAAPGVKGLIAQGPFRASDFEPGRFRLITCFQTMEHVDDPLGLCRDAYTLLKDGGALFLVCHNFRALSARLMGLRSPIFDIEHLQLFSRKSIREALTRAEFADVELHTVVNRYPVHYWAKLAPLPSALKSRVLRRLEVARIGRVLVSVPVGNIAALAFKRR